MTDRIHALTVILERDIRTDDLMPLVKAIQQLRGVVCVSETHVSDIDTYSARVTERAALREKLFKLLADEDKLVL